MYSLWRRLGNGLEWSILRGKQMSAVGRRVVLRCPFVIPGAPYVAKVTLQMWLRALRWEIGLGVQAGSECNHKSLPRWMQGDVYHTWREEVGVKTEGQGDLKMLYCRMWRWKGWHMPRDARMKSPRSWKKQGNTGKSMSDFWPPEMQGIHLSCFKPLCFW